MVFLIAAAVFVGVSMWMIVDGEWEAIFLLLFSLLFASISLCWVLPYFQNIVLTKNVVQVFLGPVKLQEIMVEDIHTILYSTVNTSLRRRPNASRELTEVPVLVLSTRSSGYLKMTYRRFASKEIPKQLLGNKQEEEEFILQYAIDSHIGSEGRNFRLPKEEGVWMEYTPERFCIVQELYPHAEDCTS